MSLAPASSGRETKTFFALRPRPYRAICAATTGRLITDLVTGQKPCLDPAPYRIDRFCEKHHTCRLILPLDIYSIKKLAARDGTRNVLEDQIERHRDITIKVVRRTVRRD